jgi:hypothetical protein
MEARVRFQASFVNDEVELEQVFLRTLRFFPLNIVLPMLHFHPFIHIILANDRVVKLHLKARVRQTGAEVQCRPPIRTEWERR